MRLGITPPRLAASRAALALMPLEGLGLVDDEAGVGAGADLLELVLDCRLEDTLRPSTATTCTVISTVMPMRVGARCLTADLHSDRILPGIGVLDDELAAGMLDVEDHGRRP